MRNKQGNKNKHIRKILIVLNISENSERINGWKPLTIFKQKKSS